MTRRAAVAVAVVIAAVGGCAILPAAPGPLPTDFIPSTAPSATLDASLLSPDGFDAAQRMTVRVRNIGCDSLSTASGFAVDEHTFVTNRHVVEGSRQLEFSTYDGRTFEATAAGTTTVADLAIVHVDESLTDFATLAADDPEVADAVTVIAYPEGGRLKVTRAIVITNAPEDLDPEVGPAFGITAALKPGSSGAPVVNEDGEVVGVVYALSADGTQTFIIPISKLRELLAEPPVLVPESATC